MDASPSATPTDVTAPTDVRAPAHGAGSPALRVAAAPSTHPVGTALADDDYTLLPSAGPALSSAQRLRADDPAVQPDRVDLVHLHGGVEGCAPDELAALLATLCARGVAVVASLGELRARDEVDRDRHDARLRVLLEGADACTTTTRAAALEARERFGIGPVVVPQLGVVPDARAAVRTPRTAAASVVGLGVTRLDARTALAPAVEALCLLLEDDPDVRVQLHVHEQLDDRADDVLAPLAGHPRVATRVAGWMPDARLYDWVEQLDVLLLAHRWSTHSDWVGLARSLGTVAVGVATPSMRELGLEVGYAVQDDEPSPDAMRDALGVALALARVPRPPAASRRAQLQAVRTAHATLYGLVTGRPPG